MNANEFGFATRAIHQGQAADPATGATVVPIYATSTFTQAAPGEHRGYEYSPAATRHGQPCRNVWPDWKGAKRRPPLLRVWLPRQP